MRPARARSHRAMLLSERSHLAVVDSRSRWRSFPQRVPVVLDRAQRAHRARHARNQLWRVGTLSLPGPMESSARIIAPIPETRARMKTICLLTAIVSAWPALGG